MEASGQTSLSCIKQCLDFLFLAEMHIFLYIPVTNLNYHASYKYDDNSFANIIGIDVCSLS